MEKSTFENAVIGSAVIATALAIFFAKVAVVGYVLMLAFGAIWHEFDVLAPIGYWNAVVFSVLLVGLFGLLTKN